MKLSFSLPSKPSAARPDAARPAPTFAAPDDADDSAAVSTTHVTEFDASRPLARPNKPAAIPPQANTFRPERTIRNLFNPSASPAAEYGQGAMEFEPEKPASEAADSGMSYGLNLRNGGGNGEAPVPSGNGKSVESATLEKFKEDMKNLPEDRGMDEFKEMPVEGFGAALLAGYGWTEGRGIGRNAKEDVKVVQYVRRAGTEGLGFVPPAGAARNSEKGKKRGRDSDRPVLVAPRGADGRTRHVVGIDEKLVPREEKGVLVGKVVRVVDGRHIGLKGKVMERSNGGDGDGALIVLKLVKSEVEVSVGLDQVAELGSAEEERYLRKLLELKIKEKDSSTRDGRDRRDESREERRGKKRDREEGRRGEGRRHDDDRAPMSWLRSHIRVRIISKDFKRGRLYLKKGVIMDVVGPTTCDISMDESRELVQGVEEEMLETALPKKGGPVLVLSGKHKGVFGSLAERNMEKETGVVQDADSHELLTMKLEQIAEYVGDPSYLGY